MEKNFRGRMRRLKILKKDIKEIFIRSSGHGGQKVNKVSTCVFLQHLPTGIKVKYRKERSRALNRRGAYCLLLDKIEKKINADELKVISEAEKIRRRERKKPRVLKEKILTEKHLHSEKKMLRKKINEHVPED